MRTARQRRRKGEPSPTSSRKGRHFLRAAMVSRTTLQVGEPVQVRAKLRKDAPEELTPRVGGVVGLSRYVSFRTPGTHFVDLSITHPDGRRDKTTLQFDVVDSVGSHPFPILDIRQEPTNPFLLHVSLQNVSAVHRPGVRYEWTVDGNSVFTVDRPYFIVDCDRLLNGKDLVIPCDLAMTVLYPDGVSRTAKESFRVFNDYVWQKQRGILQPRLTYDYVARGSGLHWAASCVMSNEEDEPISLTGKQIEILYDDPDRVLIPGPLRRLDDIVQSHSQRSLDCSLPRRDLPEGTIGYAVHFHGTTPSGLKVQASAYFEHYTYHTWQWSDVTNLYAVDLLNEVKLAMADSTATPRPPVPVLVRATNAAVGTLMTDARSADAAPIPAQPLRGNTTGLTVNAVRNYVEAMRPTWTPAEAMDRYKGLDAILGGGLRFRDQDDEAFFLGKPCLLDEDPPTNDLFCKGTGRKGDVFVPSRIMNGKKGDVVLLPGGPLGFIGKLLMSLDPPQFFSHCGIMTGNFYKVRHATASDEWLEDELTDPSTAFSPDDPGTDAIKPESLKYIWPGTIDQSVDQAFHGSLVLYESRDGKRKKNYNIQAFSKEPVFFLEHDRHVVFPLVLKPDPLLEGEEAFAHVRPTLHKVADKAKQIDGHYRFFCYSDGAISLKDDTAHRAPDQGAKWWASNTRPMICSTLVLAAIDDVDDAKIRVEGADAFTSEADLERVPLTPGAKPPDQDALVDALTRDGLYLYTSQERLQAGEALYEKAYAKAKAKAGTIGTAFTDAPDDFANQICNTFAFDYSGREFDDEDAKDSDKWRTPGDGHAVSPDDMLTFWDSPRPSTTHVHGLYGTSQRVVFREGKVEQRELGVWVMREKLGKLTVKVVHRGQPIPGADVKVGGRVGVTNSGGTVVIELPEGDYAVEAGVFRNGLFFEGSAAAVVKDRGQTSATIELNDPPEFKRLVMIGGGVHIKDLENGVLLDKDAHRK